MRRQVKLYSVLHLRNNVNWYLTDFKENNCMAVKDMFLLQVQTLSRRLREENGTGRLEKQWLHFK